MSGGHGQALNGKIFKAMKPDPMHITFVDAITEKPIWNTSSITNVLNTVDGITITTQNTTYDLIDVMFLLPTTTKIGIDEELEEPNALAVVTTEFINSKPINYGDGYMKRKYQFNRPTSEKEIRKFFKLNGKTYKTEKEAAWYESYVDVEPTEDHSVWIITTWSRYTD